MATSESGIESKIKLIFHEITKKFNLFSVATTTSNDPAILHFAQNTTLTRYDKAELKSLQDSKQSQSPPQCLYDPRVIKLNILKYEEMSHSPDYEEALKIFRDKLQNLTLTSWDPKLLQLLNNYHNSLLFPGVQSTGKHVHLLMTPFLT